MTKTAFIQDLLKNSPDMKAKEAVAAWLNAGNESGLSVTAFYKAKRDMGLGQDTGKTHGNARKATAKIRGKTLSKPQPSRERTQAASMNGRHANAGSMPTATNDQLEADIDNLIFKLSLMSGTEEIQGTLRVARRQLCRLS